MIKSRYHVFYLKMAQGQVYQGKLPVYCLARELPIPGGSVQLHYAFFPQYRKKSLFRKRPIVFKPAELQKCLNELEQRALEEYGCREMIYEKNFGKESGAGIQQTLPTCVMQAWLHAQRPFDTLCVTADWDTGMYAMEQLVELLNPYLPRLKNMVWLGEENAVCEKLRNYLYEEYGMILLLKEKIPEQAVVIQKAQAWNFLDAMVKNGYNTLVH